MMKNKDEMLKKNIELAAYKLLSTLLKVKTSYVNYIIIQII